jgi:hypothetical protein
MQTITSDGIVKSLNFAICVIPAKAGIQCFQVDIDSDLRRNDGAWDFLRCHHNW